LFENPFKDERDQLPNASCYREIVSGRRRGLIAPLARCLLRTVEVPYTLVVRLRNRRFDRGHAVQHVGVPVVSVGNVTLGGTGKTPLVEWIARWYRDRGVRVALVSRGYRAAADAPNDEARELEQKLPDVPHVQDRDRVAAARRAVEEHGSQLILLDDAFQHRRLARDLDIVLIDALEPFGFDHVFPRGTLREPLGGLRRADVVVLSRADLIDDRARWAIWDRLQHYAPAAACVEARHAPRRLLSARGNESGLDLLAAKRVAAFCGIGNPAGFRGSLQRCGCEIVAFREFPDHHRYTRRTIDALARWADALPVAAIVTTHKDLVKLDVERLGRHPLWALVIGTEFLRGGELLEAKLASLMPATGGGYALTRSRHSVGIVSRWSPQK
jgi:tetraacyldisaccharide 4'-kinase